MTDIIEKEDQRNRHYSEGGIERQTLFRRKNKKTDIIQSEGRTERQTLFRRKSKKTDIIQKEEWKDRHYS